MYAFIAVSGEIPALKQPGFHFVASQETTAVVL